MLPSAFVPRIALSFLPANASLFKSHRWFNAPLRRRRCRRRRRNKTFSCTSVNLIFHYRRRYATDVVTVATICVAVCKNTRRSTLFAPRIWEERDEILPRRHEKLPKHGTLGGISKDSISPASWIFPWDLLTVIGHPDKTFNSVLTQFPSFFALSLINIIRKRSRDAGWDANDLSSALPCFANRIGINPWTLE